MSAAPEARKAPREIPGPFDLLWRWLNSLPIAIVVMLLLAVLTSLGTMIPQSHLAQPPQGMSFEQFLEARYGVQRAGLIKTLGLHQIYFTWYFFLLMLWLSVSAVVCNITRFRRTISQWTAPPINRDAPFFTANPKTVAINNAPADGLDQIELTLSQLRFRIRRGEYRGAAVLYADRGYLRKWALVVLHVAILVLIGGGIIGATFGSKGMVRMADHEVKELILQRDEHKHPLVRPWLAKLPPLRYQLDQTGFRIDYDTKIFTASDVQENVPEELHEYYRYFVRQFISTLAAEHLGHKVGPQEVYVNKPLNIEKLVLYQSGYVQIGFVSVDFGEGRVVEYEAPANIWLVLGEGGVTSHERAALSGMPVSSTAFQFEPVKAGELFEGGKHVGYVGPLSIAHLADRSTGSIQDNVLVTPEQGFTLMLNNRPVTVRMSKKVENYSDFSYQRDPGLPILGLGWLLLVLGITVALYTPFTQVHARQEDDRTLLLVMGQNSRVDDPLPSRLRAILMGEA
jgi:cytochrome c biogenesis protein ResB